MLRDYIAEALKRARYTELEDGIYCAEVAGLRGVIATGETVEACRGVLEEVIEGWILVRVAEGLPVPALGRVRLRIPRAA